MKFESLGANCHKITVSTENESLVEFFLSFNNCVAVRIFDSGDGELTELRIFPSPSRTTTKHLERMGVYDWPGATAGVLESHLSVSKLKY